MPHNVFNSASVVDDTGYSQSFSNAVWSICVHMSFQVYESMYEYRIIGHHIVFFIGVYLIYNVMLISAEQPSDSAPCRHRPPPS